MTTSPYSLLDLAKALLYNVFAFDDQHPLLFTQFYFWAFFAFPFLLLCLSLCSKETRPQGPAHPPKATQSLAAAGEQGPQGDSP